MSVKAKQSEAPGLKLAEYLPFELSVASNLVSELIAGAYAQRFNLTIPQWRVIAVLGETSGLAQKEICAATAMDKVTVSRAAAALGRRKLVTRAADAMDGRSSRLALTREGVRLYQSVAPLALSYEAALLADTPARELEMFRSVLHRLQARAQKLARGKVVRA